MTIQQMVEAEIAAILPHEGEESVRVQALRTLLLILQKHGA